MAWIESHQTLRDHPKTLRLCALLKVSRPSVVGHLHLLWWWCIDYAPDGNVKKFSSDQLATAAEWVGNASLFVTALRKAGFLDGHQVHDWEVFTLHYNLSLEKKDRQREQVRERVKRWRNAHVTQSNAPTVPYRTVPTKPTVSADPQTAVGHAPTLHPWLIGLDLYVKDDRLKTEIWTVDKAWMKAFPGIDIGAEIRKAHAWEMANPSKRKVDRIRFFNTWLGRSQDRPHGSNGSGPAYITPVHPAPNPPSQAEKELTDEEHVEIMAEIAKAKALLKPKGIPK